MKRTGVFCILALSVVSLFPSCVSTDVSTTIFDKSKLSTVEGWNIRFAYETVSVDQKQSDTNAEQISTSAELQLLDDIYYFLKEKGIAIGKDKDETKGVILIHPVYSVLYSYFKSIDVTIYNSKKELMVRLKFDNEYKGGFVAAKRNNELSNFASEKIFEVLTK